VKTAVTAVVITLMAVSMASGNLRAYAIDPVRADWSGKADPRPDYGVSEVITCNFDELDTAAGGYVELFVGDYHDTTSFNLGIYEYPDGVLPMASALGQHPTKGHSWLRFPVVTASGQSFTKGKRYEFKFTRSGSDSIQYYYQGGNPALSDPYSWGWMRVGGTEEVCMDLCARVCGRSTVGGQATAA
jgi:hypothetical protein